MTISLWQHYWDDQREQVIGGAVRRHRLNGVLLSRKAEIDTIIFQLGDGLTAKQIKDHLLQALDPDLKPDAQIPFTGRHRTFMEMKIGRTQNPLFAFLLGGLSNTLFAQRRRKPSLRGNRADPFVRRRAYYDTPLPHSEEHVLNHKVLSVSSHSRVASGVLYTHLAQRNLETRSKYHTFVINFFHPKRPSTDGASHRHAPRQP